MTNQDILNALSRVRYPGTGKDIVSAGMVMNDIVIDNQRVTFSLFFEKINDPFQKSVLKAAEQAILTYIGGDVDIRGNIAIKTKQVEKQLNTPLSEVKNIIAIFSGKGGVGKSTVSANLAVALARQGYKVGLLDADIYGPSIPKMFGVEGEQPLAIEENGKQLIVPIEKFGVKMLSIGFFISPENALVWRGTMAGNALKQFLNDAAWGALDFFIIDLPPGTGDIQLTITQYLHLTGAIVVSTPQEVALADARKGINMFQNEKIGVKVLGLVENMAFFTPAELPENKYFIFGKDGGKRLAEELNVPLLAQIPLVQSVCESGDNGKPIAAREDQIMSAYFSDLAQKIVTNLEF